MTKESNQVIVARQINSLDAATATKAKSPRELANFQNKGKVSSANPQGRRTSGRTDAQKSSTKPHHPNDVKQFCDYNADNVMR